MFKTLIAGAIVAAFAFAGIAVASETAELASYEKSTVSQIASRNQSTVSDRDDDDDDHRGGRDHDRDDDDDRDSDDRRS